MRLVPGFLTIASIALASSVQAQDKPRIDVSFREARLATAPADVEFGEYRFSPDGSLVAYEARKGGAMFVVAGGKKGEDFESISGLAFGPDGKTFAYVGRKSGTMRVVVGNRKGPEFDRVALPLFSPDGKTLAYTAAKGDKSFVVLGEHPGEAYDSVGNLQFGADGRTLAYVARNGTTWHVVVGERKGKPFDEVSHPPVIYANGTVAYQAKRGPRSIVVLGDQEFGAVALPVLGPDGKTFARIDYEGDRTTMLGKYSVVVGDRKGEEFDGVTQPTFSPDGKVVAYSAYVGTTGPRRFYTVVGDRKFDGGWAGPEFSPDGMTLACVCQGKLAFLVSGDGGQTYAPPQGKQNPGPFLGTIQQLLFSPDGKRVALRVFGNATHFIALGDRNGESFQQFGGFKFSPDGKTLLSWVKTADGWSVIAGEEKGPAFDEIRGAPVFYPNNIFAYHARRGLKDIIMLGGKEFESNTLPVLSSDGKTFALAVFKGSGRSRKVFVAVGGQKGEDFDEVTVPVFSPDGRKAAYGALNGREFWWKVMEVKP